MFEEILEGLVRSHVQKSLAEQGARLDSRDVDDLVRHELRQIAVFLVLSSAQRDAE